MVLEAFFDATTRQIAREVVVIPGFSVARFTAVSGEPIDCKSNGIGIPLRDGYGSVHQQWFPFLIDRKPSQAAWQMATSLGGTEGIGRDEFFFKLTDNTAGSVMLYGNQLHAVVNHVRAIMPPIFAEWAKENIVRPLVETLPSLTDVVPVGLPVVGVDSRWDITPYMHRLSLPELIKTSGTLDKPEYPYRKITYTFLTGEGKRSGVQHMVKLFQEQPDGSLALTRSAVAMLLRQDGVASHVPDGTDIFVPITVVKIDNDQAVAVQHGVTMTAETLHSVGEQIRAAINSTAKHDRISPIILETLGKAPYLSLSPLGKENLRRVSMIHTIAIGSLPRTKSLPPSPSRVAGRAPELSTSQNVRPGSHKSSSSRETDTPATIAVKPVAAQPPARREARAPVDRRPELIQHLDAQTQFPFEYTVVQADAARQIQEVMESINFTQLGASIKGIEGVTLSMNGQQGAVLHADLLLENGNRFGVNLLIRNDDNATTGIRTELKLGFIERQLAKAFAGDKLDMVAQIPDLLLRQLNTLLNNVSIGRFSVGDGTFIFTGKKR